MVKRILTFITTEIRGLHEAAYLLAIFAFLSQVLALVRDKLLAFNFGAGEVVDMYYAAFRIPDFVFVTVATLVSASVIVPFLVEKIERGHTELHAFIREITTLFGVLMIVVGGIAWFAMPYLVDIALPGFNLGSGCRSILAYGHSITICFFTKAHSFSGVACFN